MVWEPDPDALRGKVAVVAGATRGAGRWNQTSATAAQLASEYGFTDLDGTQPDAWALLDPD